MSGSGSLHAEELISDEADVRISGSGNIRLHAERPSTSTSPAAATSDIRPAGDLPADFRQRNDCPVGSVVWAKRQSARL